MSRYTVLHIQDAWEIPEFMSRVASLVADGYTHINEVPAPCCDMAWLLSDDKPDNVQDLYEQWMDDRTALAALVIENENVRTDDETE